MKVFFACEPNDRAMQRINLALANFAPNHIQVADSLDVADLVVIHVVGRQDHVSRMIKKLKSHGQSFAILQLSIRSTQRPSAEGWLPLWRQAKLVVSYYHLPSLCAEDNQPADFNFYYSPWGVDTTVFQLAQTPKKYIIATSGSSYLHESIREAVLAARQVGKPVFNVGSELNLGSDVECSNGMSDDLLSKRYSACEFVAGLRRIEGFEFPAAEGLLCGARPIMFDQPHYRAWFNEFAEFIPENSRDEVVVSLEQLFRRGARPITEAEIDLAKQRFSWETIVRGFWERINL